MLRTFRSSRLAAIALFLVSMWTGVIALPATDTFLQSTGSPQAIAAYSGSWTVFEGGFDIASGSGRAVGSSGGTYNNARWNLETFNADQYSQITYDAAASGDYVGPTVAAQTGVNTSYHAESNGSEYYVSKCVAGSQSNLVGPLSISLTTGDVFRLERTVVGGDVILKVFKALAASPATFVQQGSDVTDSSSPILTAGYAGIFSYRSGSGGGISYWEGGNLGGGGDPDPEPNTGRATLLGVGQ